MNHHARDKTRAKAAAILWTAAESAVRNARNPLAKHGDLPVHFGWEGDHIFK